MAYLRHEVQVTNPNFDGASTLRITAALSDQTAITQTQLNDAVSALADFLETLPGNECVVTRYDETGTVV